MNDLTPKEYVLRTLSTCNKGSRITEVLLHYWKHEGLIKDIKDDIVQVAEEIFNEKATDN